MGDPEEAAVGERCLSGLSELRGFMCEEILTRELRECDDCG